MGINCRTKTIWIQNVCSDEQSSDVIVWSSFRYSCLGETLSTNSTWLACDRRFVGRVHIWESRQGCVLTAATRRGRRGVVTFTRSERCHNTTVSLAVQHLDIERLRGIGGGEGGQFSFCLRVGQTTKRSTSSQPGDFKSSVSEHPQRLRFMKNETFNVSETDGGVLQWEAAGHVWTCPAQDDRWLTAQKSLYSACESLFSGRGAGWHGKLLRKRCWHNECILLVLI